MNDSASKTFADEDCKLFRCPSVDGNEEAETEGLMEFRAASFLFSSIMIVSPIDGSFSNVLHRDRKLDTLEDFMSAQIFKCFDDYDH